MAGDKHPCGFDLSQLPGEWKVQPKQGSTIPLSCPLCGDALEVKLQSVGVLARGSGEKTEFLRWKLSPTQPAGTTVALGQFKLRFAALGTIEPRDICYPTMPAFVGEAGDQVVPSLPVRREFFDCVDLARFARLWQDGRRADIIGGEYKVQLPLRGHDELVEIRRTVKHVFRDVNLRIWPDWPPDRCLSDWRFYLVGLATSGPGGDALLGGSPRVRIFARSAGSKDWGKPLNAVQRGGESIVGAMDERPSWVGLELTDPGRAGDDAAEALAGGCFFVPPATDTATSGDEVRVGLDFGTSNTCVAFKGMMVSDDQLPTLVPKVDERDWNLYLFRGGPELKTHKGPDLWPSPTGFGAKADLFASELLFARPKVDQNRLLDTIETWRYGIDFGLPSAGAEPAFSESEFTLSDFKWQELLAGSSFVRRLEWVQAHYLVAVLMNAYVRAVLGCRRGAAKTVSVQWSYPISFNKQDLRTLHEAAKIAQDVLARLTGLDWTFAIGADESVAAAANAGDPGAKVAVYLDMGGGSTDVAIKIERRPGKWEDVYLTSVRYAGMSLLAAYQGQQQSDSCLAGKTTLDVLRRRVREAPHLNTVLGDPTLFNKNQDAVTRNRTFHFYGYLTEYVARMLAAGFLDQRFKMADATQSLEFPRVLKIAFYFLGNGWRFNAWLAGGDQVGPGKDIWKRMMELLTAEKSEYADRIRAALKGARLSHSTEQLTDVPHEKAAVAFGLLREARKTRTPDSEAGTSGILGWETRIDGTRPIPWFAMYNTKESGPPALTAGPGGNEIVFGETPSAAGDGEIDAPWYRDFPSSPSLDWLDTEPRLPIRLESPFELDKGLNMTRRHLKSECMPTGQQNWFAKGPYEVMLEELFRPKLKTIGC
jgi:hypothetical protein